jgi:hypothetical protein
MIPKPPARLTADAKDASAIQAIPPWITGHSMFSNLVSLVCIAVSSRLVQYAGIREGTRMVFKNLFPKKAAFRSFEGRFF